MLQWPLTSHSSAPLLLLSRPLRCRTAKDLLARALERISGSLFLTQERLDHFMGEDRFDKVELPFLSAFRPRDNRNTGRYLIRHPLQNPQTFASKYIFQNWRNYTFSRGTETYDRCAVVGNRCD